MKKLVCSVLALVMLLSLLSGCNSAATPEADTQPSETITSEPEETTAPRYIPDAEICLAVHNDPEHNDYSELYTEMRQRGWISINGRHYYIDDVYPTVEWTPEELIEYYRSNYWDWGAESGYSTDPGVTLHLWNADFTQHFVANKAENWLTIDGVKICPLNLKTYSMKPEDLVQAFQAKEWKIGDIRRSDDFSTVVSIDDEYGFLTYEYHVWGYENVDLEKHPTAEFGYDGFNDMPWWREDGAQTVPMLNYSGYGGHELDGSTYASDKERVLVYPDVPWDQQKNLFAVRDAMAAMVEANANDGELYVSPYNGLRNDVYYGTYTRQAQRNSDGLYAVTAKGIQLWRAGVLRQTWSIPTDSQTFLAIVEDVDANKSENYAYSQGKFYHLLDDGSVEVVMDRITDATYCSRNVFMGISLRPNGALNFAGLFWGSDFTSVEIATNVKAAILDEEAGIILYTTADGNTYAVANGLHFGSDAQLFELFYMDELELELVPLGQKSAASIIEEYDQFCSENNMDRRLLKAIRIFLGLDELKPESESTPATGNSI